VVGRRLKERHLKRHFLLVALAFFACTFATSGGRASMRHFTDGTWTLYPEQQTQYTTDVQQPINADGSSCFKDNGKAVIPVKFSLLSAPGPVVFESIYSDSVPDNDFSFLSFTPSTPITFNELTELRATYAFTLGNNHGGALRWSVRVSPTQS